MDKQSLQVLQNIVLFFNRTDGRDKLVKFLQNFCRYRKYYETNSKKQKQWKAVQSSLSEFRSIIKFGKPFKNLAEVNSLVDTSPSFGFLEYFKTLSLLSDIGYKVGDNLEYLSHYKFLSFNEERCESWSKMFQFYAYFIDAIVGWYEICQLRIDQFKNEEEYREKRKQMILYWSGDLLDFFRVTPKFLFKKHDGFSGLCGLWVGLVGCIKVWNKVSK